MVATGTGDQVVCGGEVRGEEVVVKADLSVHVGAAAREECIR